jgi:hypothetical protein
MRYLVTQGEMEAAARRLLLMSFKGIGEIYPNDKGADSNAGAPPHHSDEFPDWLFLNGMLSSIARLRFTSRSRSCFRALPTQGHL